LEKKEKEEEGKFKKFPKKTCQTSLSVERSLAFFFLQKGSHIRKSQNNNKRKKVRRRGNFIVKKKPIGLPLALKEAWQVCFM